VNLTKISWGFLRSGAPNPQIAARLSIHSDSMRRSTPPRRSTAVAAIHWETLRLWLKGARLVPRQNVAVHTGLSAGNSNDYT
jgi:hypothetical protein